MLHLLRCGLLGASLLAAAPAASALQSDRAPARTSNSLRTLLGRTTAPGRQAAPVQLRNSAASVAWIQRIAVNAPAGGPVNSEFTSWVLRLTVPATGESEAFTLHVPGTPLGVPRPLLVGFHGFGVSHLDFSYFNTDFLQEAASRDWLVLAPAQFNPATGSWNDSWASTASQLHVEALMDYVISHWAVDLDRIYGVGFSMGGGNALSYAARHRDRDLGAFAAVINHTGSVCISDVYANNPPSATCSAVHPNPTQVNMRDTFGAPPPSFAYQRSSLIDLDANGQLIAGGRHMAVNLADVPVRTHYSALDTIGYLREQSIAFDGFLRPRPEMSSSLIVETQSVCPSSSCNSPSEHCWDILDATASCDWLSLHTLEAAPPRGELLADRDARWGGLEVELHQQGSFGAATYDIASSPPTVQLLGRENLARVAVDLEAYGLDPNAGFDLVTSGADPLGTEFVFSDVSAPPSQVTRETVTVAPACPLPVGAKPPAWCYDAATRQLRIWEGGAASVSWRIR
jgi:poly(3-hydroxybutyrate) depolymerase